MITTTKLEDGIVRLDISTPGPVNTLSRDFNLEFGRVVDELLGNPDVTGIVVTSPKDDFAVGGNLDELRAARTPDEVAAIVDPFTAALRRLETGGKPVVAALNGTALGGGYELALGCHRRVAADRKDAQIGLPEAGLGLMPGGGGTQRLPRLIGLTAAADLILRGKTLGVAEAHSAGLVDEVVPAADLIAATVRWIKANPKAGQPWDQKGYQLPGDDPNSQKGRMFFAGAWAKARQRSASTDAAAFAILHALHHGLERTIDPAIAIERRQFIKLAASPEAKNRVRSGFYGPRAARPNPPAGAGDAIKTLGVVGGGMMGNGIAFSAARAGLSVRLIDVSEHKARESFDRIAAIAGRQMERGRMSPEAREALLSRVGTGADYAALRDADFVIEAVFERLDVKHDVLGKVASVVRPGVTIASNTSTIPMARLAQPLADRGRLIGMHFFAPVETMKLLEVVHGADTSAKAKGEAQFIAKLLGKTPIVVNDGLGFYTSRIVSSLSSEAMTLVAEGVAPQIIDNVMLDAGFAIGPATLAELTKLPLLRDIMASMSGEGTPVSMKGSRAIEALDSLIAAGREGKLAGKGIYDYTPDGPVLWAGLKDLFPPTRLEPKIVRRRLLNTQSLEAVRALEDGTVTDPLTADMAAVTGWGYPIHLGGPFACIDTIGARTFVEQCRELEARFGERFAVPALLDGMARDGTTFHSL